VVVCVAGTGAAFAIAGRVLREIRLVWTGGALVAVATAATLDDVAPVDRFLIASEHPGAQSWAPLACAVAGVILAWAWVELRQWLVVGAAAVGLYALSLAVLELVVAVSPSSIDTDFQRGHTVVTGVWAASGLALLTVGLMRRSNLVRVAGLGLFGISLAKLFLYDLAALSSITRAAAFLVVGGLLLAGGFLVQRLAQRERDTPPRGTPPAAPTGSSRLPRP
jgi:uncharacterized membrane protein